MAIDPLLTVEEAATILRCSPQAIRDRIHRRQIESIKSGNRRLVRESAIESFLRKNTTKAIRQ